jgi:hypothetical protein
LKAAVPDGGGTEATFPRSRAFYRGAGAEAEHDVSVKTTRLD